MEGGLSTPKAFSKAFFDLYFVEPEAGVEYDLDEEPVSVVLSKRPGYGLQLSISPALSMSTLYLVHPSFPDPVRLGWSDHAHWHPHVLRVEEVEEFCTGVTVALAAQEDPSLELFGRTREEEDELAKRAESIARILLCPFTVPTPLNA